MHIQLQKDKIYEGDNFSDLVVHCVILKCVIKR
jgi:hypothetical protein